MKTNDLASKLKGYPDVVTFRQFCKILNGVSDHSGRVILKEREITHFTISGSIMIPLKSIKDYLLSPAYEEDRKYYPTISGPAQYVIAVRYPNAEPLYHRRSHGQCETKKGSFLVSSLSQAKKYTQYHRALKRVQQMTPIYGEICEIIEIRQDKDAKEPSTKRKK